jgi:hypothetical protein
MKWSSTELQEAGYMTKETKLVITLDMERLLVGGESHMSFGTQRAGQEADSISYPHGW